MENQQQEIEKNCIFCKIAKGEIPSKKVYEDDVAIAILDINPASPGHVLLIPKKHYFVFSQVNPQEIIHMGSIITHLSRAMIQGLGAKGTNVVVPQGEVAGQRSPHAIVHIIPRYEEDGLNFSLEEYELDEESKKTLVDNLRKIFEENFKTKSEPIDENILKEGCEICEVLKGQDNVIFHKQGIAIIVPPKVATAGHIKVVPTKHKVILESLEPLEFGNMLVMATMASAILFMGLKPEGTILLVQNGVVASQRYAHIGIEVLPKRKEDSINISWNPGSADDSTLTSISEKLIEALQGKKEDKGEKEEAKEDEKREKGKQEVKEEKDFYEYFKKIP